MSTVPLERVVSRWLKSKMFNRVPVMVVMLNDYTNRVFLYDVDVKTFSSVSVVSYLVFYT